jgi:uncharacterized protein with von Willebrand factor type A (vWA) domain
MQRHKTVSSIPDESLAGAIVSFGRVLKENGFPVAVPNVLDALSGAAWVGVENLSDFRTVLKAVFVTRVEELGAFDRLFQEFWLTSLRDAQAQPDAESFDEPEAMESGGVASSHDIVPAEASVTDSQELDSMQTQPYVVYSAREALRTQDFRDVPRFRDQRMARLIREVLRPLLKRVGVRKRPVISGAALDFRRLLRRNIRYGGELFELPRLKPRKRVKKLVFLCDVSGSMNPYLRFMLRFIREIQTVRAKVETFVFATSLHRVTPLLARSSFPKAMQEIGRAVRDWSGGTRIGACLHEFTSHAGPALLGPSTVVMIFSDGWDRGDIAILERAMINIHRKAYRVLWINPLLGSPSYEPTCRGMKAALPHVDWFLSGHNIMSLERLAGTLRGLM